MAKNSVRYLDLDLVEKLASMRGSIKRARGAEQRLSGKIKDKMNAGYICPTTGPYVVELSSVMEQRVDWEGKFFRFLKLNFFNGSSKKAEKYMNKIKARSPKKYIQRVLIPRNPQWRRKKAA
jgi:hypothetical protein